MQGAPDPGQADAPPRAITVISYGDGGYAEESVPDIQRALERRGERRVTWIVIRGHLSGEEMLALESRLGLHPVVSEEMSFHPPGRPKILDLEDLMFISLRLLKRRGNELGVEQVNNLLGKDVLITQCPTECVFKRVRENILNERSRLRKLGVDYLLYSMIDAIVDDYFLLSEDIGDLIEDVQDRIMNDGDKDALIQVQNLRHILIIFRQSIWPIREGLNLLVKSESDLLDDYISPYFREVYDHTIELMDTVDTHRDMLAELVDIYQTNVSNQLNEVVKVLTLISVVFAPLTFIVGLYGMNFHLMPELGSPLGYPAVLLLMLVSASAMVLWFRRKGWV